MWLIDVAIHNMIVNRKVVILNVQEIVLNAKLDVYA